MKLAILKLGARLSFETTQGACPVGEAVSIVKMLADGGNDCHVYSHLIRNESTTPAPNVTIHEILNESDAVNDGGYDALIVINGNLNIYGGADNPEAILPWKIINQFQGKVFYLMCDPELPLKQIWGAIDPVKRPTWTSNYKEEDYVITREDIICVSQAPNLDVVMEEVLKKPGIKMGKVVQFSFEKFPCRRPNQPPFNSRPTYALSYGGTMRNGRRDKKMVKYYFGYPDNVKIEMFGKIKLEDFKPKLVDGLRPPEFYGYAKYDEMLTRLNGSVAHVVIGDPLYERLNLIGQRVYESISSNCVTFIDAELDKKRMVFGRDPGLCEFLYVNSREEVLFRLKQLTATDGTMRAEILERQRAAVGFNDAEYLESLNNLIKENLK